MGNGKRTRRGAGAERKQRTDGVTDDRKARFLAGLVETCHVGRAAMLAGKNSGSIFYELRRRDAEFAEQWDEAIATATARIEAGLIARALASVEKRWETRGPGEAEPIEPLDFHEVMQLLKYYRTAAAGGHRNGPKRRYATREETDAALLERLDVLEARVKARQAREDAAKHAATAAAPATGERRNG